MSLGLSGWRLYVGFFVVCVAAQAAVVQELNASKNHHTQADEVGKQDIEAAYIPLADHYAAIIAYENYAASFKHANFTLTRMPSWDLLRAYFKEGRADMAYTMAPLALDMYREQPSFRWVGLMHRDGNALAINEVLAKQVHLPLERASRKPDAQIAKAMAQYFTRTRERVRVGVPHKFSTHNVVLYHYLKKHGVSLGFDHNSHAQVESLPIAPAKAPLFIKSEGQRATPAAFEQSLPWADIVETQGFGRVAWYSKDVLPTQYGHVECIAIASDAALATKYLAVQEVMAAIKQAGRDIERARTEGGALLDDLVVKIQRHIPEHTRAAIVASLDPNLRVINYQNLAVDVPGLASIMDAALESGLLAQSVDLQVFADARFLPDAGSAVEHSPSESAVESQ
ncbi:ABC transporter substrate-binding protein [Marinagarivorans cellulosilyticus]|uniref:NitT/TauT family transport system substrate-binding protein n=1 Tax=Marinagarivorans cellulosilyticus TaxID=2721545 RepID=A0AAN1WKS3_9GAMM|nr:ABC transporter substrate-binding protein [Marinagarivorans cellulosilyticus]BCD99413.1 NitT/TauT family transport system substrate-binding protein [Marinagarivorans cellulosilyticus]